MKHLLLVVALLAGCATPRDTSRASIAGPAEWVTMNAGLTVHDDSPISVTVLGSVKNPGHISLKSGDTLFQALQQAGGANPWAYLRAVILTRKSNDGSEVVHLIDMNRPVEGAVLPLAADGDVIYVSERIP